LKILFDQGVPVPLRGHFDSHIVATAYERGWSNLTNGDLLAASEREGFDLIVTTDQNLKYQQKLAGRRAAILVLLSTSWPRIEKVAPDIARKVGTLTSGDYIEFEVP